jgi:5-methylcytosine-specific restriction endonuclease McrA
MEKELQVALSRYCNNRVRAEDMKIILRFGLGRVKLSRCVLTGDEYFRLGTISLMEGLNRLALARSGQLPQDQFILGTKVGFSSNRIQTYLIHGVSCVDCGVQGTHFAVERKHPYEGWHLNLYGIKGRKRNEVMITSDHVVPKSKGGADDLSNRQPMCFNCNIRKSNHINPARDKILSELAQLRYMSYEAK